MIYNGQETGHYRVEQLLKTEKTHIGTLFEVNAGREFHFDARDEDKTDFRIAGHMVDAKWSQKLGGWMLPPEVFGEIAMVATADDEKSVWSLGLIRVQPEFRREGANRDKKSQLNAGGVGMVKWLWRDSPLRPNVLLRLSREAVDHIFANRYGTQRTNRLFRAAEGLIVHRSAVATVSMQLDHQKRVRYNGGARSALAPEGYLILSGKYHAPIAAALGLEIPKADEYISIRVVPSAEARGAYLDDRFWRAALPDEIVREAAPRIPEPRAQKDAEAG
jgi:hypothetical protein